MGSDETLLVNYCQMFPSKLAALGGAKIPNAWGLHNVHGNVSEWYDDSYGTKRNRSRVVRGGDWEIEARFCKSAFRNWGDPTVRHRRGGFRVALSLSGN